VAPTLSVYTGPTTDYVVTEGDTLAQIARAQQVPGGWQQIAAANRDTLTDPDQLQVGQQLKLPVPAEPVVPLGLPQPVKFSSPAPALKAFTAPAQPATVTAQGTSGGVAARAVTAALGKQGTMYSAMDCSSLVQFAYRAAGVTLPRVAADQATMGRPVSVSELRPGDVLTFYHPISHIAIYVGGGKIVESSQPGRPIAVRVMYLNGFAGARRIVG
jgi:cell wall-associated NlpC family hydrolase